MQQDWAVLPDLGTDFAHSHTHNKLTILPFQLRLMTIMLCCECKKKDSLPKKVNVVYMSIKEEILGNCSGCLFPFNYNEWVLN